MNKEFLPSDLKYEFKDFIGIFENAFTKSECEESINLFENSSRLGYTYSYNRKKSLLIEDSAINVNVDIEEIDWGSDFIRSFHSRFYEYIYPIYNIKYPILQTLKKHRSRYIKIQKTLPTEGYHVWHCENDACFHTNDRVLSWILYLNDVDEGGETEFLYQSIRFKPKTGTFILFPAYFTHTHRGNPPLSQSKYIATGWIEFAYTEESQGASNFPDLTSSKPIFSY